jgi:hypothetical protein
MPIVNVAYVCCSRAPHVAITVIASYNVLQSLVYIAGCGTAVKIYPGLWLKESIPPRVLKDLQWSANSNCYCDSWLVVLRYFCNSRKLQGSKICKGVLHSSTNVLVAVGWVISVCGFPLSLLQRHVAFRYHCHSRTLFDKLYCAAQQQNQLSCSIPV